MDLDNFSGQAQRIQQEILNEVQDGMVASRTVPIKEEEPTGVPMRGEKLTPPEAGTNRATHWANEPC